MEQNSYIIKEADVSDVVLITKRQSDEDLGYREEIVVRNYPAGEIVKVIPGSWMAMPNGQVWNLQ